MMQHWNEPSIVQWCEEERTAKLPGRPILNDIMARVEAGHIQGIICWHPDRLSRNPTDAGRIMQGLASGSLKDLKFVAYTFENSAEGRFMLAIMLGQATYYSDNLSNRIKLAIRTKISQGWLPWLAPLGYLNDRNTHTIVPDPDRFDIVRDLLEYFLHATVSVRSLWQLATVGRGLRTRKHPQLGEKAVTLTGVYRMLTNPFYAGLLEHGGRLWPGKHVPMITVEQYDAIQRLLGRPHPARPSKKPFPLTGLIRCGECGYAVTAEEKRKPSGKVYVYYHCSKRAPHYRCKQSPIRAEALLDQVTRFVEGVQPPHELNQWLLARMERMALDDRSSDVSQHNLIQKRLEDIERATRSLVSMRVRELISDEEYLDRRRDFDLERTRLTAQAGTLKTARDWLEPANLFLSFSNRAAKLFRHGDPSRQRMILGIIGSNCSLENGIFSAVAAKPFLTRGDRDIRTSLRDTMCEVRTLFMIGDARFLTMLSQMKEVLGSAAEATAVENGHPAPSPLKDVSNIPTSPRASRKRGAP